MNETNVKTVKKIKKVVVTEDTRYQTFGIDTEFKSDKQFHKSENKEYSKIVNSECVDSKSNDVVVKKVKKVVKSVEPTYYVHTCGYDYVVDTIDADVAFSGTKDECDDWMKEHSIVEELEDNTNEYMEDSSCDFSDFESGKVEVSGSSLTSVSVPTVKKVKKCVVSEETTVGESVDYGKQIVFTKVTDLDPKMYEDFTKEEYKYGMIFYDFEIFAKDFIVTFVDVINLKETVIVNDRKSFLRYYIAHKNEIFCGFNSRMYDSTIFKAILLGMNPKEVNDKLIVEGLKAFQINEKFKEIQLLDFDIMPLAKSLKQLEAFMGHDVRETEVSFNLPRSLTMEEIEQTIFYNKHDVYETLEVFRRRKGIYEANIGIIEMFNFPLADISKTQAQLTAKIVDCKKPTEKRDDDWDFWLVDSVDLHKYKFIADWFMSFRDDHDRIRVETYKNGKFVPYTGKDASKDKSELHVDICGVPHICAFGGIHGAIKDPVRIERVKGIYHSDINSLYPSICIVYKLLSRNCQKPELFVDIYNKRIQYKKEKNPLAKILKVPLNANYGIMGDKNSPAYDIRNCRMVCITGQLLMITLLERIEKYITLIQSNTDGEIYYINNESDYDTVMNIIKDWEKQTSLGFTTDTIDWITQSTVNSYAFKFSNGEYERKGKYLKETNDLDNDLPIVNEAMFEHIAHNVNVADYINNCDDLIKFQKVVKVSSNYKFAYHNGEKIHNKTYRLFASKNLQDSPLYKCKHEIGEMITDDKGKSRKYNPEKFADTPEHCFIVNENIIGKKCSEYSNFDKQWYIDLAYDRLREQFHIDCKPSIFDDMF